MIIVEGPDGAGKTTLCKRVAEDFDLEICDWEQEMDLTRDEMKEWPTRRYYYALAEEFQLNAPQTGLEKPWIHDRFYFSSLVYGPLMQGHNQMSEEDRKTIGRVILALACPVIVCLPPKPVVLDNMGQDRHQMDGVKDLISDIYDLYTSVMSRSAYPFVMYYDYTDTMTAAGYLSYEELSRRIKFYLDRRGERMSKSGLAKTH